METRRTFRLARQNRLVLAGMIIAIGAIVIGLVSGIIVNPNAWKREDLGQRLCWNNPFLNWNIQNIRTCPGKNVFPLGTDAEGRGVLQMIILAIPLDLQVSFEIVGSAILIGLAVGGLAAFAGGTVDELILRIVDIFFAIPGLLLALMLLTTIGHSLLILTISLIIIWWPFYARLIRSQVLAEKEKLYVQSLHSIGVGDFKILFWHILPNSIYPILVQASLDIGGVILTFSALMFLGFSPSPLIPELGNLVNEGINYALTAPWLVIFPGLTIVLISLGFNLLGDGLRDMLDPRLRH